MAAASLALWLFLSRWVPTEGKRHLIQELEQRWPVAVSIGQMRYGLLRGLTLEDGSLVVTGNYLKLRIPPGRTRNEWVSVRLTSEHDGELLGG